MTHTDEMDLPILRGERVLLRPARPEDAGALAAILAEPAVARWWQVTDLDQEIAEGVGYAVVIDGAVRGWLEVYEEPDPMYRQVGLDIFLATSVHGRGYAREALRLVIAEFAARGHHRFTIDPAADNERAIRSYAALGFKPVGVMREYERGRDGTFHDGLLMDLLASELDQTSTATTASGP